MRRPRRRRPSTARECPLLALSGHELVHRTCPLLGVKRTSLFALHMSAYDPKRAFAKIGLRLRY